MDIVKNRKFESEVKNTDKIYSNELQSIFELFPHITTLSLDCFDTILWRKTYAPVDVFYELQHQPTFKSLGFTATLRMHAEGKARCLAEYNKNSNEVTLDEIYRESFPEISQQQIDLLTEEELSTEIKMCYGFPPMLNLIRTAHQRGIKVIIVSDTYFTESQLRHLLESSLPKEVLEMIFKIYCSCEYGRAKADGLFKDIHKELSLRPEAMLHIGDNLLSDYQAARLLKMNALHFLQKNETLNNLQCLYRIAACMLDTANRAECPLTYPFNGLLATSQITSTDPHSIIGYTALGPIMYAFAQFIDEEVRSLQQAGKKTKVAFLLRDGHLPALACEEFLGKQIGKRVRISRFASYAASFRTSSDIDSYLVEVGKTNRYKDLAKQLLLPDQLLASIIKKVKNAPEPGFEFIKQLHRPEIQNIIFKNSADYRKRLLKHLHREIGLEAGDTLVLIDLGYNGTTQRRLAPVFKEMNIEIQGRYLIALQTPMWELNRKGVIDASWCDDNAMNTLVFYIILLEQLCTSNEKSVIDYDEEGAAIYTDSGMSLHQHQKLNEIQAECIRFIREAKYYFKETNITISMDYLKRTAMGELTRLLFLPTESELEYLKTFQAEMNLGTQDLLKIFDAEQGLSGLRRRGIFYMEKPSKETRTNYPAELRIAGIELVLSLMAQHRFNLDISMQAMMLRKVKLSLRFIQGTDTYDTFGEAVATHDGFYSIWIPTKLRVSINFGKHFKWLQIDSAELIEISAFISQTETTNTIDALPMLEAYNLVEKCMTPKNGKLLECLSESSALIFEPNPKYNAIDTICRIVFRPVMHQ